MNLKFNKSITEKEKTMAQKEICILTNMCMIYNGEGKILVQDRLDPNWSGISFPGGHVEPDEPFVDSVIREVKEETGLDIKNVRLCGIQDWTEPDGSFRYIVLFFKTNCFSGTLSSSSEGKVFWIDRKDIKNYKLADGFDTMLEVFEKDELSECFVRNENDIWKYENK